MLELSSQTTGILNDFSIVAIRFNKLDSKCRKMNSLKTNLSSDIYVYPCIDRTNKFYTFSKVAFISTKERSERTLKIMKSGVLPS